MRQSSATVFAAVTFAALLSAFAAEAARWTGGGATTDWNDAGNWANGQLPGATSVVELTGNASISMSGDCAASSIVNVADSPVTLTLTANADVRLAASICGDIAVEKRGGGRLSLAARQSYSGGTHIVEGALTSAPDLSYADYSNYGTLSVHLDTSHPETLVTNAVGDLVEWKSLTDNGITTYGAETAYPTAAHGHDSPSVVSDWWGRPTVRFGQTNGDVDRGCTFISAASGGASTQFKARTFFLVQRQRIETSADAGLLGMIKGASFRFYRDGGATFRWSNANMSESWNNGRKATGLADNRFELSGTTNLNLLVVRNASLGAFDIIGTQFLVRDNGTLTGNNSASLQMDFYEVLLFDEALTDAQVEDISAILMQKWKIPRQAVCMNDPLLSPSAYSVDAGATLDGGGSLQTLTEVSGSGTFKAAGLIDLKGESLKVGGGMNVAGFGTITNTAVQTVLLVVSNDTAATLAMHCAGNIDIEKQGAGTLYLVDGQMHSGETRLTGGKLVGDHAFSKYGTLSVHLDASHPETLVTNAVGDLVEWKSLTDNGVTTYGAETAYPTAAHGHASPSVISDWRGRPAVRFGETHGAKDRACTFISAASGGASAQFKARTFFLVQRQRIVTSADAGLLGMIKGASFRFYRNGGAEYRWDTANMAESWNNGRKATGLSDNRFEASGVTDANLLVVRNASLGAFDIIGTQFLVRDNGTLTGNNSASLQMDFYEVLLFDEALTDAQVEEISAILMQKWDIPQQVQPQLAFDGAIAPASGFVVAGDVALDFAGLSPTVLSLEFDATGMVSVPVLRVAGDWDVTGIPLRMTGFLGGMRGYFLYTGGRLTSPFASLSGCDSNRIVYAAYGARIRAVGLYMVVR